MNSYYPNPKIMVVPDVRDLYDEKKRKRCLYVAINEDKDRICGHVNMYHFFENIECKEKWVRLTDVNNSWASVVKYLKENK